MATEVAMRLSSRRHAPGTAPGTLAAAAPPQEPTRLRLAEYGLGTLTETDLQIEIKAAFNEAGIEIPFPHRTRYTGSVTEPFPVRVVDSRGPGADARTRSD